MSGSSTFHVFTWFCVHDELLYDVVSSQRRVGVVWMWMFLFLPRAGPAALRRRVRGSGVLLSFFGISMMNCYDVCVQPAPRVCGVDVSFFPPGWTGGASATCARLGCQTAIILCCQLP